MVITCMNKIVEIDLLNRTRKVKQQKELKKHTLSKEINPLKIELVDLLISRNCGIKAPKNKNAFGLDQITKNP